jgi:hypothetical protein
MGVIIIASPENMPLIDVFKFLKVFQQNHELIDELKNTKFESVTECGKKNNCDFNESELVFTSGYLQLSKNGNKSTNISRTSNFQRNIFDNFLLLEDNSNSNVIRRMQAECCIPVKRRCCDNMNEIVNNMGLFLSEIDSNNWQLFLSFIQDESENTREGDRMRSRNPMREPIGSIDEIFLDENPDPNDNPELSEAEIEIKWNICKEIIIEVLQEEE